MEYHRAEETGIGNGPHMTAVFGIVAQIIWNACLEDLPFLYQIGVRRRKGKTERECREIGTNIHKESARRCLALVRQSM